MSHNYSVAGLDQQIQKYRDLLEVPTTAMSAVDIRVILRLLELQRGVLIEAVANVLDKVEHGFDFDMMITKFSRIAGCSESALRRSVEARKSRGKS